MALTGFIVDHVCQPSASAAIDGIASGFPVIAGNAPSMVSFSGATYSAPNTFNLTLLVHDLTGQQSSSIVHSIILISCDPSLPIDGGAAFDPALAASLWSFALVFVLGSWLVANNVGLILSAIKRW